MSLVEPKRSFQAGVYKRMGPFVSVIIPTFNRVDLLGQTVDSVRNQSFTDREIIVVDDGSTDGTWEWLSNQNDLQALRQENKGIATSRNNGVAMAKGEWLAFLDHDDLWAENKLSIQVDFIKRNPDVALVAAKHVRIGKRFGTPRHSVWIKGDLLVKAFSESFIHTSSVMIKKAVFDKIGGFCPRYRFADEFDVWLKIARDYAIAYVNQPLVFIRFYEFNTSHDRIGLRHDTYDILLKHYDPKRIPLTTFLRTLSDHDISFGRAYLRIGDLPEALRCFHRSVKRTPLRFRSWRYYIRYRITEAIKRKASYGAET
ncbi:MAG: glycosyltransferase [Desulfomonile sp.]